MKILICGSRDWLDRQSIKNIIDSLPENSTILHGGARGADRIAGELAEEKCGIVIREFKARWNELGIRAGILRNIEMLNCNPDIVYAFPEPHSVGTYHTIAEAEKRGIKTLVYGKDF